MHQLFKFAGPTFAICVLFCFDVTKLQFDMQAGGYTILMPCIYLLRKKNYVRRHSLLPAFACGGVPTIARHRASLLSTAFFLLALKHTHTNTHL